MPTLKMAARSLSSPKTHSALISSSRAAIIICAETQPGADGIPSMSASTTIFRLNGSSPMRDLKHGNGSGATTSPTFFFVIISVRFLSQSCSAQSSCLAFRIYFLLGSLDGTSAWLPRSGETCDSPLGRPYGLFPRTGSRASSFV